MFKTFFKTFLRSGVSTFSLKKPKVILPILLFPTAVSIALYESKKSRLSLSNSSKNYELTIEDNFHEGEMRAIQVGPKQEDIVLVSKVDGEIFCTQGNCPHVGANLSWGVLLNDRIVCPYHHATFSVKNGYPEEGGPSFDALQTYPVEKKGSTIHITVPKDQLNKSVNIPMSTKGLDSRKFLIVGGGPAGLSCAETLRQCGFQGDIVMISNEQALPYNRTVLSKWFLGNSAEKLQIRSREFLEKYGITVVNDTNVDKIDFEGNTVHTDKNKTFKYDKLLLATGGTPFIPPIKGSKLKNVIPLRNGKDLSKIQTAINENNAKNIVIIGASFIGLEMASTLIAEIKNKVDITVVADTEPFEKVLGKEVGNAFKKLHEKNGVKFHTPTQISQIEGQENANSVVLANGTKIPADLVIMGTGVRPNVNFLKGQLPINDVNGGVETDIYLNTSRKNVYAAGDIASFPFWYTGDRIRIEHYNEAIHQGSLAGFNMMERNIPLDHMTFFWTRQHENSFHFSGCNNKYDDIFIDGNLKDLKFIAYYLRNNKVVAACSMNKGPATLILNEAMRLNLMPSGVELKSGKSNLEDIKRKISQAQPSSKCRRINCCRNKNCMN